MIHHSTHGKGRLRTAILSTMLGLAAMPLAVRAQSFPPTAGDDTSFSIAVFRIAVRAEFESLLDTDNNPSTFTSYPGYDYTAKRLTSPLLNQGNTIIGRSAPGIDPMGTVPVGSAATPVGPGDYTPLNPAFLSPPAGTREVRTEVRDLNLQTVGQCYRDTTHGVPSVGIPTGFSMVKGGTGEGLALCPGLIQANQVASDFPAKSVFQVYVQVTLPPVGFAFGSSSPVLYNDQPLEVFNPAITAPLPPHVVYEHEQSTAVPLKFKFSKPGYWNKDDVFGYLVLAGHATQVGCDSNSTTQITSFLDQILGTAANPVAEPPIPTTALNGTTATAVCCGMKPTFPGQSNYSTFNGQIAAITCFPSISANGAYSPSSYAFGILDLQNPAPPVNVNYPAPAYHGPNATEWTGAKLGTIFGVCFDDKGNIYVTPTTCYNITDTNGISGNLGSVYKINGVSGLVTVFANLPNAVIGGVSAGLGNIKYSCQHSNFYVSDHDDGRIYRLDTLGNILSTWDHGANLPTATPPAAAIPDTAATAFTPVGRRIWGLKPNNGRLYYAVWWVDLSRGSTVQSNEIWSIALAPNGSFIAGTDSREISVPHLPGNTYSGPVSDISFGPSGSMLLAERSMYGDSSSSAHQSRLLEYVYSGGSWIPSPNIFQVSQLYPPGSSAGGCDYDWSPGGRVWVTGDAIHLNGPNDYIYGAQGLPATGGSILNSVLIDFDGNTTSASVKTEIGDIELPCVPSGCLLITNETVDCIGTNGTYNYQICATNLFNGPISFLSMLDAPPGVTFSPDIIPLGTPLQPGQGTCVSITVSNSNAGTATNLCFRIGAHTSNFVQCCASPHCIALPKCCAHVFHDFTKPIPGQANCYTYSFALVNTTVPPVPISYCFLIPDPPNNCFHFTPDILYFNPPIQPGAGMFITNVTLCVNQPCNQPFCFEASMSDSNLVKCCAVRHCVPPISSVAVVTNPTNGTTFSSSTNISISAGVDPTIFATGVVFYANGAQVASAANSGGSNTTVSAVWNNPQPGIYSLVANALDQFGGGWASFQEDAVSIVVYSNAVVPGPVAGSGPTIASPRVQNGALAFSVQTPAGVSCVVEWSDSLTSPNWHVLESMTGDGNVMTITDALTNAPQRFYRVRTGQSQ